MPQQTLTLPQLSILQIKGRPYAKSIEMLQSAPAVRKDSILFDSILFKVRSMGHLSELGERQQLVLLQLKAIGIVQTINIVNNKQQQEGERVKDSRMISRVMKHSLSLL